MLAEHEKWYSQSNEVALDPTVMTAEHVAEIRSGLLRDFSAGRTKADEHRERGEREKRLLVEQKFALELLQTNPHIYFEGPAGTGKSFLLVEAAVRFSNTLSAPTLVTCWNLLMAEELRSMVRGRGFDIEVDDLNTVMLRLSGLAANPPEADDTWYCETLPAIALEAVRANPHLARYGVLCIDEFQDVADKPAVLDLVFALTPSLKGCPVVLAGDDRQRILGSHEGGALPGSSVAAARARIPGIVHARVRRNCRMLPSIAKGVGRYLDPQSQFTGHRMPNTIAGGTTTVAVDPTTETAALAAALRELLEDYLPEDIVVLSPFGATNSLVARVLHGSGRTADETWLRKQLAHEGGAGRIPWFSISKFKGLDADAVVVTDLNPDSRAWVESAGHSWDDFRYVAESRGKYRTILLDGGSDLSA